MSAARSIPGSAALAAELEEPSKPISCAIVGATSASETRSLESAAAIPVPKTTSGTRSRYIQTLAWLVRGSFGTSETDSCG